MKHSDVTISILCATAFEECKRCVASVLATREGATLILTSNGNLAVSEYFERIAMENENVLLIFNTANLGFIEPNNHAFSLCETPFFVMLNDDAVPPPDWLEKLKTALADENTVIAGPNAFRLDENFVGGKRGIPHDYIEGSCMMVKVDAIRPHGLFSDYLSFAYCEDADLCLRMRSLGYEIKQADFGLYHRPGTTSRTVRHLHEAMRKNFEVCKEKWGHYLKHRTFA